MILDEMAEPLERLTQVLFQQESGVIGSNGDSHSRRLYYGFNVQGSGFRVRNIEP